MPGKASLGVGACPYLASNFLYSIPGAAPAARKGYKGCLVAVINSLIFIPPSPTICCLTLPTAKDLISCPFNILRCFTGCIDSTSFITPSTAACWIINANSSKNPFNPILSTIIFFNSSLVLSSKAIPSPLAAVITLASFKISLVGNSLNLLSIAA